MTSLLLMQLGDINRRIEESIINEDNKLISTTIDELYDLIDINKKLLGKLGIFSYVDETFIKKLIEVDKIEVDKNVNISFYLNLVDCYGLFSVDEQERDLVYNLRKIFKFIISNNLCFIKKLN